MKCDKIQHRAMRFFIGFHKYTTIHGPQGDMGWVSFSIDRRIYMVVEIMEQTCEHEL